jgi:Domain of unknown function (DUF4333)
LTRRTRHVLLFAAFVLCGCDPNLGVGSVLNVPRVIGDITRQTRLQAGVPAQVTCPEEVPLKRGETFTCDAHFAVGHVHFTVVQTDDEGHVHYEFEPYKTVDIPSLTLRLERMLERTLHRPVVVICPQPVVERPGVNFTCQSAKKDGSRRRIVITQTGLPNGPVITFL